MDDPSGLPYNYDRADSIRELEGDKCRFNLTIIGCIPRIDVSESGDAIIVC